MSVVLQWLTICSTEEQRPPFPFKQMVTTEYPAPELLLGSPLCSPSADIWSLGCIFTELINGHHLFRGTHGGSEARIK